MKKVVNAVYRGAGKLVLIGATASAVAGRVSVAKGFDANEVEPIPLSDNLDLMQMVSNIVDAILLIVGIIAVVYLIYGGIQYVTAGGEAEKATKGRTTITNAIIGIVIIMASWAIYNFVLTKGGDGGLIF